MQKDLLIPPKSLPATLAVPDGSQALVIFAHGSGSSRLSPRNRAVASALNRAGFATLLFDLLTPSEERDRANVFAIGLLAERLMDAVRCLDEEYGFTARPIGFFGASTGGAAAIVAAAHAGGRIGAVISRGGRPDLAGGALEKIVTPTLLIVGGDDHPVVEMNEEALRRMNCPKRLEIIPGATHLFPEKGAIERVTELAIEFFTEKLIGNA